MRFRRAIGAEAVQVWADVKKKHSAHAITADVGIGETAHAVEFMRGGWSRTEQISQVIASSLLALSLQN